MQPESRIMSCRGWLVSVTMHALLGAVLLAWHGTPPPPPPELAVPVELWSPPPEEPPPPAAAPAPVAPQPPPPAAAKPAHPRPTPVHRVATPAAPRRPAQTTAPARTAGVATTAAAPAIPDDDDAPDDAAPPTNAAPAEETADEESLRPYLDALQLSIQRHVIYPAPSLRRREQGRVPVRVTLAADGTLLEVEAEGNPPPLLAQAAVEAVQACRPFGRLPGRRTPLSFVVGVNFDLH